MYNKEKEACQKKKRSSTSTKKNANISTYLSTRLHAFCIFSWWSLQAEASRVFTHTQIDNKRLKGTLLYPSFPDPVTHSLCLLRGDFLLPVNIISDWNPVHPLWQFRQCNKGEKTTPPSPALPTSGQHVWVSLWTWVHTARAPPSMWNVINFKKLLRGVCDFRTTAWLRTGLS